MDRRSAATAFGADDSLLFFGQVGQPDFSYMAEASEAAAEEQRIKAYLSEAGERGLASRRRVVCRPLGGASYQAQSIVFSSSERDRDGASSALSGSEPLSELLQQLAASRKGQRTGRDSAPSLHPSLAASLTAMDDPTERKRSAALAAAAEPATPAQLMRANFVQELMLSALSQPVDQLDGGPLDLAFPELPPSGGRGADAPS